jgi:hypothetical protein
LGVVTRRLVAAQGDERILKRFDTLRYVHYINTTYQRTGTLVAPGVARGTVDEAPAKSSRSARERGCVGRAHDGERQTLQYGFMQRGVATWRFPYAVTANDRVGITGSFSLVREGQPCSRDFGGGRLA